MVLDKILSWFGPSRTSLKGYLSAGEISRCLETSVVAAAVAGLGTLQTHLGEILAPEWAAIVAFAITLAIRSLSRLNQGSTVVSSPSLPTPVVAVVPAKLTNTQAIILPDETK